MSKLKAWLWKVGFWEAESLEAWSWSPAHFRLLFWRTPSNQVHRAYRGLITELTDSYREGLMAAYQQGVRDGALQLQELMEQEDTEVPATVHYLH